MRNFRLIPQLLIVLALLICQQFAISHSISHIHQQIEQINQDGHTSDEANCDTCHALGGLNHFFVGLPYTILIQANIAPVKNNLLNDYFDSAVETNFQSRAPPFYS